MKAVVNVRSFAREWQGCAKLEDIFPNYFNQIHPNLFLNISLAMAKKSQTYDMVTDYIFLLTMITKSVFIYFFC